MCKLFIAIRPFGILGATFAFLALAGSARAGYKLELVASGLNKPLYATHAPGDPQALYIVPQRDAGSGAGRSTGTIVRHDLTTGATTPFLQVTGLDSDTQGGLHALAFHPDYAPGVPGSKLYLIALKPSSTAQIANNTVQEWVLGPTGTPEFARTILQFPGLQPNDATHAMDWLGFRPGATGAERNYLYLTVGDGGVQANENNYVNHAADLSSLRGKMLRLDVSGMDDLPSNPDRNYGFTPTIYFGDDEVNDGVPGTTAPEVYYSGLRNPWRASFDRQTGDIWIGDVGFGGAEELNYAGAGAMGLTVADDPASPGDGAAYGIDFGWPRREGLVQGNWTSGGPRDPDGAGIRPTSVDPVFAFTRSGQPESIVSITGGYVYRGENPHPAVQGKYFLGGFDFPLPKVITADFTPNATGVGGSVALNVITTEVFASLTAIGRDLDQLSSFAEDAAGELYLLDFGDECSSGCTAETGWTGVLTQFGTGEVYRLVYVPGADEGDYNDDGAIDAADYTVWRDHLAENFTLLNESVTPGVVNSQDYSVWLSNFGAGSAAGSSSVPEPGTLALVALALFFGGVALSRKQRAKSYSIAVGGDTKISFAFITSTSPPTN